MKAVFFDLDNTLYDARQYYFPAFKEIADYLSKKHKLSQQKVYENLINVWEEKTSRYPFLLNDLLKILNIKNEAVKNLVRIFNNYSGSLEAYPRAIPVLEELKRRGYQLGIVTDGNIKRQARKIKLLKIKKFFDIIIYTKAIKAKPSSKPFLAALEKLKLKPKNSIYVGDNPSIDFMGAKKIGMKTIRLKEGEFKKSPQNEYVDFEIEKIDDLLKIFDKDL